MNTDYCTNNVDGSVADEDFWIARWNKTSFGDPLTTGSPPVGVFGSGNWDFWQYDSPNGLGATYGAQSVDIDLDVAHGDINFVRSFLIPEPASSTLVMAAFALLTAARPRRGSGTGS